ncbi:UDP-N-acetylmuramyl pentapeptide phosphotransferase/UDP-N-acetylglucosamine-1-phosphate transferase [Paenibacillus phyllosphaerae]|uniref:UDP-N-acetylmuramyl pentapeptide phosphotransferase/UDP-N-acetylglucosamine-1-phosphate transferase n=1 Tax=Paenibacillus phyllosphaerae TaxID=274593 RepID=A0A7W5B3U3_9BACL|nr:hypothetical protein [Paenibacillus phyllosphaerae]MBB3113211.1 UDP-N-acetylmuramyl pentapeptide phosphotransferase/UDP-N-acetylglucosamine-1-phosphate transferase [Paenibacillus phyllosphaerae]
MISVLAIIGIIIGCYIVFRAIQLTVLQVGEAGRSGEKLGKTRTVAGCIWVYTRDTVICLFCLTILYVSAQQMLGGSFGWYILLALVGLGGLGMFWPRRLEEDA